VLRDAYGMHTVQEPLGHKDVHTMPNYTHVLNRRERGLHGPLDQLWKRVCGETLGIMPTGQSV
jgi:hypothetical protein